MHRLTRMIATVAGLAGTVFASLVPVTSAAAAVDPSGTWLTADGRARIRIEKCGPHKANLCGYIVWLQIPLDDHGNPFLDDKNPDPQRQSRPALGLQVIMGMAGNADGSFEGKIYDSDNGTFENVKISSDEEKELSIRGCRLRILCGSQTWTRVSDIASGQLDGLTNAPNGPHSDPEWTPKKVPNVSR